MDTQTTEAPVTTLLADGEEITVTPDAHFVSDDFFKGWDMGTNARRVLLGITEETDGQPVKVRVRPLLQRSLDAPIITELGEFPKALTPLPVWAAIAKSGRSFVGYVQISGLRPGRRLPRRRGRLRHGPGRVGRRRRVRLPQFLTTWEPWVFVTPWNLDISTPLAAARHRVRGLNIFHTVSV